jgi:putative membrane protein
MSKTRLISLLFGLVILFWVFQSVGLAQVLISIKKLGWRTLILAPFFIIPTTMASLAWRSLFTIGKKPAFTRIFFATWVGLACNWLLPVAQIGGELVKARLLSRPELDAEPWSTMVLDKTFQVITQIFFTMLGLGILMRYPVGATFWWASAFGLLILSVIGTVLICVQRWGFFLISAKLLQPLFKHSKPGHMLKVAKSIDNQVILLHEKPWPLVQAFSWRLGFRFCMAGEIYLIMFLMGSPVTVGEAIVLESLGQAVRMMAFFIPAGLGAQEGALALIGASLGLPSISCLALSIARRMRELMVGLPGLVALWGSQVASPAKVTR